jgi:hypothetical protein
VNERSKERRARLAEVERELAQLKKKRRILERDYPQDLPEAAPATRRQPPAGPGAVDRGPFPPDAGEANAPARTAGGEDLDKRERFASYFMTGSLGRAAPQLRRERRAMKNKAILMAVVALFFLIVLVYFVVK